MRLFSARLWTGVVWTTGRSVAFAPAGGLWAPVTCVPHLIHELWTDWVSSLMLGAKSLKCGWDDEMLLLCTEEKLQMWMVLLCCRMAAFAG